MLILINVLDVFQSCCSMAHSVYMHTPNGKNSSKSKTDKAKPEENTKHSKHIVSDYNGSSKQWKHATNKLNWKGHLGSFVWTNFWKAAFVGQREMYKNKPGTIEFESKWEMASVVKKSDRFLISFWKFWQRHLDICQWW